MDNQHHVSEWLQSIKPVRNMSFSEKMDTDVDVGMNQSGTSQGQTHLPPASLMSISMTNNKMDRYAQPTLALQFFMAHKVLMDPQNVLQLVTRYSNKEILTWANEEIKRPILKEQQLKELSRTAITQVAQHLDNGEEILRNAVEFARQHNRLHCFRMTMSSHQQRRKGVTLVSKDMDSWYDRISHAVESDEKKKSSWLKAYRGSATPFGRILGSLLYDPLFTYRSLDEIPDRVLLEYCISHSYEHVSDKIRLNNPYARAGPQDIIDHIEKALHNPAVWDIATTTTQTSTKEKTLPTSQLLTHTVAVVRVQPPTEPEYFKKCGNCIDIGSKSCCTKKVEGKSLSRQPGQHCTKCKTLGVPCTDRLKPTKVVPQVLYTTRAPCAPCAQKGYRCTVNSFSKCCEACAWEMNQGNKVLCSYILDEYRQRQSTGGHERETLKQGTFDDFASKILRSRVFEFLDCSKDAPYNMTINDAVIHSNFKERELRQMVASLSQIASEAHSQMAFSAAAKSASACPTIVIDSDSDEETVKAANSDDEDGDLDDKCYDSLCASVCDDTMVY